MKKVIIQNTNRDLTLLHSNNFIAGEGTYRVITKSRAGFMKSSEFKAKSAINAFRKFQPKAIQSIEFLNESNYPITVYARVGKKIFASTCFLSEVEVGDINQDLYNTALYCPNQYKAVNAKTWADKAYVVNKKVEKSVAS